MAPVRACRKAIRSCSSRSDSSIGADAPSPVGPSVSFQATVDPRSRKRALCSNAGLLATLRSVGVLIGVSCAGRFEKMELLVGVIHAGVAARAAGPLAEEELGSPFRRRGERKTGRKDAGFLVLG